MSTKEIPGNEVHLNKAPEKKSASQLCAAAHLSASSRQRAADFILEYGTNLQRERYLYHFSDSPPGNVLAALSHYHNADGGFGHGLEADLRTRHSSVISTTIALQILQSVQAMDSKLASDGIGFLVAAYDGTNWQNIDRHCNDAPHAPWWKYQARDTSGTFLANPGAEVISYLLTANHFGFGAMIPDIPGLLNRAIDYLLGGELEMHELLCFTRLYDNPQLDAAFRERMLPHLLSSAYKLVNSKPQDWEEYCLTPLTVINHRHSIYTQFFTDVLEQNFIFQISRQAEDGNWSPNWSWGGAFPAVWKSVETEIKADLTLKFLVQLQQFDLLEDL